MKSSRIPTVLAATALVVALFAATPISHAAGRLVLGKNTVGTTQLKKNAVTTGKVRNGSLLAADFKAGQLPAGPKGDQGPIGPSDGFVVSALGPISVGGDTVVKTISLPAGNYVLTGRVELVATQNHMVRCRFSPSATLTDSATVAFGGWEVDLVTTDVEVLPSPTTVAYRCRSSYGATAYEPVITATKVGSLTIR